MKKFICLSFFFAALVGVLSAQDVEIYPEIGYDDYLYSIAYSPDGKWILTNSHIFDANSGRKLRDWNGFAEGWSPDGKNCLLIAPSRNLIGILDLITGKTIWRMYKTDTVDATYRQDGRRIVSCSSSDNTISIWDVETGNEIRSIVSGQSPLRKAVYSPDGRRIISSGDYSSKSPIKIWDAETGRELMVIQSANGFQYASYSPDGKRILAITNSDGKGLLKIFDTETGKEIRTLSGFPHNFRASYSTNGQKIITAADNNIKIWDAETGREIKSLGNGDIPAVYSPDNRRIAYRDSSGSSGYTIKVLDADTYREIFTIKRLVDNTKTLGEKELMYTIDGKKIVIETNKHTIIWDMENGRRLWSMQKDGRIIFRDPYFSPNNQFFAKIEMSANVDRGTNNISIYDTGTGRLIRTWSNLQKSMDTTNIIWSQDSRQITTYSDLGLFNSLDSWNIESGQRILSITHNRDRINDYSFNPDGGRIAYLFEDSLQIWDARNTRRLLTINGSFNRFRWNPNGRQIITSSGDGTIKLWDVQSGRELPSSIKHENLRTVEYSPDGRYIITGDWSEYISLWSAENGRQLWQSRSRSRPVGVSFDGKKVIEHNEDTVYVRDAGNGNILGSVPGNSASISPDGKWIVTRSDGVVRVYSTETYIEKARFIAYDDGEWLAMTPDGYYTASAKGDQYLNVRVGNTVTGIDRYRSTFNKPAVVAARLSNSGRMNHNDAINSVAVNPGGTRIAAVSQDKLIKLWDLESGRLLRTITNTGGYANAVSFSPDGRRLIHGAEDKTIRIWDAESGGAVRTITGHTDYVNEARYSPDGRRIASCADDKLIKIWDAETGREIRSLAGHTDLVTVVAWNPGGRRIASGSDATEKTIRIWDAESGRVLQTITGQGGRILALAYSPDGKKIASSALEDKAVKIWDAETGRLIRSISVEDNGGVYSLAWSPDGKRLASGAVYGGEDDNSNHIQIWNTETGENIRTIWESGAIFSLAFTPDGRRIVVGCTFSDAQFVKVYDALTGEEL